MKDKKVIADCILEGLEEIYFSIDFLHEARLYLGDEEFTNMMEHICDELDIEYLRQYFN